MRVIFRVDASPRMGGGHAMRCLTLADAIRAGGGTCRFVAGELPRGLAARVRAQGHDLIQVPPLPPAADDGPWDSRCHTPDRQRADAGHTLAAAGSPAADWLVVDHYGFDRVWEEQARRGSPQSRLMAIDDLANRPHACDLLLDQTFGREESAYRMLVPEGAKILAGSRFALLRPEFALARGEALRRRAGNGPVERVLVSLGSTDVGGITARVLAALGRDTPYTYDVVLGREAPSFERVRAMASGDPSIRLHLDVERMAPLMVQADLAIGAAGATSWERCCLGLPTLAIVLAANQRFIAEQLAEAGAHRLVAAPMEEHLRATLNALLADRGARADMSRRAAALVDTEGSGRVFAAMQQAGSR